MVTLTHITLSGYKSIKQMSLDLGPLNVLIGPNGAGKSNLVSFFNLLSEMRRERLQSFIGRSGKASSFLFYGPKTTTQIQATLRFQTLSRDEYTFRLAHSAGDTLTFDLEKFECEDPVGGCGPESRDLGSGHDESRLVTKLWHGGHQEAGEVCRLLRGCTPFQFHDTSTTSRMRQSSYIHDNRRLRHDAGNLAAVLYKLSETQAAVYDQIVQTIRQIAPWFGDFAIEPLELDPVNLLLNWRETDTDLVFGPHQISDGSLRAMALITLLLQPRDDLPSVIVIDEPELGLHPHAMVVVASLIKAAACHSQIVLATQSTCLLDQFEAEDLIVVDRDDRESVFKRLTEEDLTEWLEEYSLSELWEKNVLGGGPV